MAMHINLFSKLWRDKPFYAFPPFAVIRKVLHKIVLKNCWENCCTCYGIAS